MGSRDGDIAPGDLVSRPLRPLGVLWPIARLSAPPLRIAAKKIKKIQAKKHKEKKKSTRKEKN
jgi:hypothetical protein